MLSVAGSSLFVFNQAVAQEAATASADAAQTQADAFAQIRAEIEAMRASYESEIKQLKNRVEELESERVEDQAKLAQVEQRAVAAEAKASTAANTANSAAAQSDALSEAQMAQIEESFDKFDVTRGFEFGGYFRSGLGVDDDGNTMEAFQAPGAGSKYRLGNEAETYVEMLFGYTFPDLDLPEGTEFYVGFMPSYVIPTSNADDTVFSMRQAYASAKGVWAEQPEATFWAGQIYYDRYDVHMTDFYYLDMSGFGGGVQDIQLGDFGTLSVAWLGGSIDELEGGGVDVEDATINGKNTLDVRIKDIDVPGGKAMLWAAIADLDDNDSPNGNNDVNIKGDAGAAFGILHESSEILGGRNRAMVQYGFGAAANFKSTEPDFDGTGSGDAMNPTVVDYSDIWHFRFTDDFVIEPDNTNWTMQATFVYDLVDAGLVEDSEIEWVSFGVRPVYHFNDYWSLAFEAGVDHTDSDISDISGEVYKLTIAPQITPGRGHFARPAIRMFVTYAWWSDDFETFVAPTTYGNDTDGITFGVQAEAWW